MEFWPQYMATLSFVARDLLLVLFEVALDCATPLTIFKNIVVINMLPQSFIFFFSDEVIE